MATRGNRRPNKDEDDEDRGRGAGGGADDQVELPRAVASLQSFMTTAGGDAVIELIRTDPIKDANGTPIKGFLDNVTVGTSLKAIKDRFGGGQYRLLARAADGSGKILAVCDIEIAGVPATLNSVERASLQPAASAVSTESSSAADRGRVLPVGDANSVPVGAPMHDFMLWMVQLRIAEIMSGAPVKQMMSMLQVLMPVMAQQRSGNPLTEVEPVLKLLDHLEARTADRGGGDEDGGMLESLLKLLPALISKPAVPRALPAGAGAGKRLVAAPVEAQAQVLDAGAGKDENTVDKAALLNMAVGQVVNGFRLDMPADRVVKVLKTLLQLNREQIASLQADKQTMLDYAQLAIADDLAGEPEEVTRFADYFSKVFDGFTDLSK